MIAPHSSNCLFWATWKWFRHGGYIACRRTTETKIWFRGLWPHFFWSPDGERWYSFSPDGAKSHYWKFSILFFKGKVKEGLD